MAINLAAAYVEAEEVIREVGEIDDFMANEIQEVVDHIKNFPQSTPEAETQVKALLEAFISAVNALKTAAKT